ncbi:hypothetical protein [Sporocytophaga myxococcoides]|uniref:hypothetical protein n=1 Tax=Sporocytophaga myxococcoides TaxID=153721 RepID=UPI00048C85FF|nr:hypothetical protein [Sporocytophaga myxococcoides]
MLKQLAYLFLLIFSFIFGNVAKAQVKEPGYTYIPWERIKINDIEKNKTDTVVIIITTRKFSSDKIQLFSKDQEEPCHMHYVVARLKNKSWNLEIKNSFEEAALEMPSNKDFLFYVHGDGKSFPDVLEGGLRMSILYGINFVAFDYPTKDEELPFWRNFHTSIINVNNAVTSFGKMINEVKTYRALHNTNGHYTLLLHSLGNVLIRNSKGLQDSSIVFENIVMNAPAVKQRKHSQWVEDIAFQNNIYIISNRRDIILTGAYFLTFKSYLGKKHRRPLAENATYVRLDNVAGHKHSFFIDIELLNLAPSVKHFYDQILHGLPADNETCCYLKAKKCQNNYSMKKKPDCKFLISDEKIFVTSPASPAMTELSLSNFINQIFHTKKFRTGGN